MRRFNTIIESANPPGINQLWIDKKKLRYFTEGKWHLLGDGGSNPPEISDHDTWIIDGVDTGKPTRGEEGSKGDNGLTPFIGTNKHWWIGTTDTGVVAEGTDGIDGDNGLTPQLRVTDTAVEYSYDGITWTELIPKSDFVVNNEYINNPDEEDITVVDDKLKFRDKNYSLTDFSGLGRVYLRKNLVEGKNVLTQEMISIPNTIYYIQYDYDLNGISITVPNGCTLEFIGGSLSNGELRLNNKNITVNNGIINCVTYVGEDSYNAEVRKNWWWDDYKISINNTIFRNKRTVSLDSSTVVSYMTSLTDEVLSDNSYCGVILQNVIGVTINNCIFDNIPVAIKYITSGVNQSVARINILNNKIKHSYCCLYGTGSFTSPDFGDTTFSNNEIYAFKYGINVTSMDGLLAVDNTIYCPRNLDSECLVIGGIVNANIVGNQVFGGIVGAHLQDYEKINNSNINISNNTFINQGTDKLDILDRCYCILIQNVRRGTVTITGNSFSAKHCYKFIAIKDSTIVSLTDKGNEYDFRPFGRLINNAVAAYGADMISYYNPFSIENTTVETIESDIFYGTGVVPTSTRSNIYTLNQKYTEGRNDVVTPNKMIYVPKVKYNNQIVSVIDITTYKDNVYNGNVTVNEYIIGKHYVRVPIVKGTTTIKDVYTAIANALKGFSDVVIYDDIEDNNVLYIRCSDGFRTLSDDIRIPVYTVIGGFDMDYSSTPNQYTSNLFESRPIDSNLVIGNYIPSGGTLQDRIVTLNQTSQGVGRKVWHRKDAYMFILYSSYTTEEAIAKVKSIIDSGIYDSCTLNGNLFTIKKEYLTGFTDFKSEIFSLDASTQWATLNATVKTIYTYTRLKDNVLEGSTPVDDGKYLLDTATKKVAFKYNDSFVDSLGNPFSTKYFGTTSERPTNITGGTQYFDTTLGKPFWYDGTAWITYPDSGGSTMAALTFTGAVEAAYNGSTPVTVNIPTGGGGTTNYEDLSNKPKIGDVELVGTKTLVQLGIQPAGDYATETYVTEQITAAIGTINTALDNINGEVI